MRFFGLSLLAAALPAFLCGAAPALSQTVPRGGDITCKGPFSNTDTGQQLLARYKKDARIEPSADITGEPFDGLFLFPDDRHARLELEERSDEGRDGLQAVRLYERDSIWTMGGLRLGMTLEEFNKAHGGPLTLSGIEQMTGIRFSILGWIPDGECEVVVVFDVPEGVRFDHPLYQAEVMSDDPRLASLNLKIDQLTLKLPSPIED